MKKYSTPRKSSILIAVLILLPLSFGSITPQSGHDLFQKALAKERAEGNLEEAIVLYQKVVNESKDKSLAAKAQLRIGICYEKLGQKKAKQAQEAYQKVVDNYPDQTEPVKIAKEKLAQILMPQVVIEKGDTELKIRRVWAPAGDAYSISPNGRYLSLINWETIEIAVRDLKTGKNWDLTDEGTWYPPMKFPDASIWSPDSKRIAYFWIIDKEENRYAELRTVKIDGTENRILCRSEVKGAPIMRTPWPREWSRDGKHILALREMPDKTKPKLHEDQIVLVSVADGSVRVLKSLGDRYTISMSISPDSRYIVYDLQQKAGSEKRDIFLLSTDGKHEIPLVKHPANDETPFWAPDGKQIVFLSDRIGTTGLWGLKIVDGKPQGEPELLKGDLGETFNPLGITDDGSLYYQIGTMKMDVYIAELDFESGKVITPPKKLSLRFEGRNWKPVWSPNGKYLAYMSLREYSYYRKKMIFVIHNMKTGEEHDISTKLIPATPNQWFMPRWSPDNRSLLVHAETEKQREGFFLVDIQTGQVTPLVLKKKETENIMGYFPQFSPDRKKIIYLSSDQKSIVVHELKTGREKEFNLGAEIRRVEVSPDGSQLAFRFSFDNLNKLWVIPSIGGEPRELLELPENERIGGWCWTHDGRHVVFLKRKLLRGRRLSEGELWQVAAEGGKPKKLNLSMKRGGELSVHPDGRRITFTRRTGQGLEIWALENFLPKLKGSK